MKKGLIAALLLLASTIGTAQRSASVAKPDQPINSANLDLNAAQQ